MRKSQNIILTVEQLEAIAQQLDQVAATIRGLTSQSAGGPIRLSNMHLLESILDDSEAFVRTAQQSLIQSTADEDELLPPRKGRPRRAKRRMP